jgi:hypothetical protein
MDSPKDTSKIEPEIDEIKPSETNKELDIITEPKKEEKKNIT